MEDKFVDALLNLLPEEGLKKLNSMLDAGEVSEEQAKELMKEFNISAADVAKKASDEE